MHPDEQEQADIREVLLKSPGLIHVGDPNVLSSFNAGKMIFDVTPHAERLEAFVQQHGLQHVARRGMGDNFPSMNILVKNRRVYITKKASN